MVRQGMDFRCDVFEHEHHLVTRDDGPEVIAVSVSACMQDVETQPELVEVQGSAQIINNEKRRNAVQQAGNLLESSIWNSRACALLRAVIAARIRPGSPKTQANDSDCS
jgi:hypothetical protein